MSKGDPAFPGVLTQIREIPDNLVREALDKHGVHLYQVKCKPECTAMTSPASKLKQVLGWKAAQNVDCIVLQRSFSTCLEHTRNVYLNMKLKV